MGREGKWGGRHEREGKWGGRLSGEGGGWEGKWGRQTRG